jgi:regulatory protein
VAFGSRPAPSPASSAGRGRGGRDTPPADPVDAARQICLNQLEYAPRTRAELATTLRKKGIDHDVAEQVLSRFAEVGMIDDALFAQMWVASRHRGKGLAGRALSQELRRKGVADETAAEAVAAIDRDQELSTARELVDRKLRTTAGLATDARVRRLAGMLARKGYPAGTAFRVVREALADEGEAAELGFDELQSLEE